MSKAPEITDIDLLIGPNGKQVTVTIMVKNGTAPIVLQSTKKKLKKILKRHWRLFL